MAAAQGGHAQWLAGLGITPERDGDSTGAFVLTYLHKGLDVEAGYKNKHTIDRNQFNLGPQGRTVPGYGFLAVRYRWQWRWGSVEPFFATGGMLVSRTNTLTSTHFQFSNGIGVRMGNWEVSWRHFSNAGLGEQNEGDDFLLFQYQFQ